MSDLRKAKRAAAKAAVSRAALEDVIRELHSEGASLRKLAEATGMSHTQIARVVRRDKRR